MWTVQIAVSENGREKMILRQGGGFGGASAMDDSAPEAARTRRTSADGPEPGRGSGAELSFGGGDNPAAESMRVEAPGKAHLSPFVRCAGPRPDGLTASGKRREPAGRVEPAPSPGASGSWVRTLQPRRWTLGLGSSRTASRPPLRSRSPRWQVPGLRRQRDQRRENRVRGAGWRVRLPAGRVGHGQGPKARAQAALPAAAYRTSGSCRRPVGRRLAEWASSRFGPRCCRQVLLGAAGRFPSGFLQRRLRPQRSPGISARAPGGCRGQRVLPQPGGGSRPS